jgi:DNA-binding transcriptional regulator YhcF (GntR family)
MTFQEGRPIYTQLMDEIKGQIVSGRLDPGAKVGSTRELAAFYTVNPNTVQRTLAELEREGWLLPKKTSGKVVTEDLEKIRELRSRIAAERIETFLSTMDSLGFGNEDIRSLLDKALQARKESADTVAAAPATTTKGDVSWERQ